PPDPGGATGARRAFRFFNFLVTCPRRRHPTVHEPPRRSARRAGLTHGSPRRGHGQGGGGHFPRDKHRSLNMRKIWPILAVAVVGLGLGLAVVGYGSSTTTGKDKMQGATMQGDKIQGDKMGGDKMGGEKMQGDKMQGDKK